MKLFRYISGSNTLDGQLDHQSFTEEGFSAISFTQGHGYDEDPTHHSLDDVIDRDGFSIEQIARITEAMIAVLASQASYFVNVCERREKKKGKLICR
eukprot:TRINITY_DN13413_c0_g1_i1.p1 TRINITY_DN13413_c0_g1~~TRINITY_DN13413_c0_g1_i1.p1  ORF type:complete len:97 (+),score=22.22 TRINITY_DN13413_c0_g1_i1:373-663(+)